MSLNCLSKRNQLLAGAQMEEMGVAIYGEWIGALDGPTNANLPAQASQMDAVELEFTFGPRREENLAARNHLRRAQPAARSIYILELAMLQYRGRREINSQLTRQQNEALDHFLNEYSEALQNLAAAGAHRPDQTIAKLEDVSAMRVLQAFDKHFSPQTSAVVAICEEMIASLHLLRNESVAS